MASGGRRAVASRGPSTAEQGLAIPVNAPRLYRGEGASGHRVSAAQFFPAQSVRDDRPIEVAAIARPGPARSPSETRCGRGRSAACPGRDSRLVRRAISRRSARAPIAPDGLGKHGPARRELARSGVARKNAGSDTPRVPIGKETSPSAIRSGRAFAVSRMMVFPRAASSTRKSRSICVFVGMCQNLLWRSPLLQNLWQFARRSRRGDSVRDRAGNAEDGSIFERTNASSKPRRKRTVPGRSPASNASSGGWRHRPIEVTMIRVGRMGAITRVVPARRSRRRSNQPIKATVVRVLPSRPIGRLLSKRDSVSRAGESTKQSHSCQNGSRHRNTTRRK